MESLFVSLKIRCGKNLRTDFAIYSGVGDFANFYDLCNTTPLSQINNIYHS